MDGAKRVSVAVRCRPILRSGGSAMHQQERFDLEAVTRISDTQVQVAEQKRDEACRSSSFTFDYIFDQEATQLEVYEEAVVDLIDAALGGNNATILAYGQTGSGKTHTMLGDVKPNPLENDLLTANSGIFLRVLSDLMEYKAKRKGKQHVIVGLSCIEIYNDSIRDLFGGRPGDPPPTLRAIMTAEDVILPSLIVKEVTTLQAVFNEIQLATARRQSRATDSNASSSRSHCLFMIDIMQQAATAPEPKLELLQQNAVNNTNNHSHAPGKASRPPTSNPSSRDLKKDGKDKEEVGFTGQIIHIPGQAEPVHCSKVLLADLAGSEKPQKSGVSGAGLAEATAINSSLTALGNVVHSLHEGGFVSYRVSSLTRMLKPTFSQPTSRVLLLANVAPTQLTFDETVSTLHFANKVKAMKVHTTNGAESEKLQFDLMEYGKTYDSLLGDLHIFTTDTGCKPILRRHGPQHYSGRLNVYDSKNAKRPYKAKERLAHLEAIGALQAASEERRAILAKREDDERNKKANFAREVQQACDEAVLEYRTKADELWRGYSEVRLEGLQSEEQSVGIEAAVARQVMVLEEEAARIGMALNFFQTHRALTTDGIAARDVMLGHLNFELQELRAKGGITANRSEEDAAFDAQYAQSAWFHCNGKRFFYSLMEMREAQVALLIAKLNHAELRNWSSRAAAKGSDVPSGTAINSAGAQRAQSTLPQTRPAPQVNTDAL